MRARSALRFQPAAPCRYNTYREYLGCAFAGETRLCQSVLGQAGHSVSPERIEHQQHRSSIFCGRPRTSHRSREASTTAITFPACDTTSTGRSLLHREQALRCSTPTTISQATIANEDQFMINTDYILNSKNTLSEKYFFSKDPQTAELQLHRHRLRPGRSRGCALCVQSAVLRLTSVVTNNFVNDAVRLLPAPVPQCH